MKENWPTAISAFIFTIFMLTVAVWCTGCTEVTPTTPNAQTIQRHNSEMAAETAYINDKRGLK